MAEEVFKRRAAISSQVAEIWRTKRPEMEKNAALMVAEYGVAYVTAHLERMREDASDRDQQAISEIIEYITQKGENT